MPPAVYKSHDMHMPRLRILQWEAPAAEQPQPSSCAGSRRVPTTCTRVALLACGGACGSNAGHPPARCVAPLGCRLCLARGEGQLPCASCCAVAV
eukprot:366513-Chlamydomonas_euryale.AAC.8